MMTILKSILVLGILGGGLAFLAEWGLYSVLAGRVMTSFATSFFTVLPFKTFALPIFAAFMAIGVLVGVFGGTNAIRNYLKV